MLQLIAIASGGAVGALLRFWTVEGMAVWLGRSFPYGTLTVNVIGSLLIGFLYVLLVEKGSFAPEWRSLLVVGLLGAFTTFSTFSLDTIQLLQHGYMVKAMINVLMSVVLCLLAVWLGLVAGRQIFNL